MPFQPVPDTAQVALKFETGGINAQNTVYFHRVEGWNELELQALAEDCVEAWEAQLADTVTADWALIEAVATNLEETIGLKQIWRPAVPIQGTYVGTSSPANVTMAVKFIAPRRGRGISGRVFPIGIPEDVAGAGSLTSAYANNLVNSWAAFANEVETNSDCQHVIVHRVAGGVRLPVGTIDSVAGYAYTDLSIDSQKLRLPNHRKQKRPSPGPTP